MDVACQFGRDQRLHGVVSEAHEPAEGAPMVVLVSAGLTGKPGPYRLYVDTARELAGLGISTLRFDLGGIGNSQIDNPQQPLLDRTNADIEAALDYLSATYGCKAFILGGLCSGAEDSFRYAKTDARVCGVVMIDPHAYDTAYWRLRKYLCRHFFDRVGYKLMRMSGIVHVVQGQKHSTSVEGFEGSLINYQYMPREESTWILKSLSERGVAVHYIYTGGRIDIFHRPAQIRSMFPDARLRRTLTIDHIPHIEHIQIFAEDRAELVRTIRRRVQETVSRFMASPSVPTAARK